MERGSFSSSNVKASIVLAAEKVASSIDFDRVCSSTNSIGGSTTSNSSEDEEKTNRRDLGERQSLLQQNQSQARPQNQEQRSSSFNLQNLQNIHLPAFPHIDMQNLNIHVNMENFEFHNLPVEVQMALEDSLLGWTHLSSITIGHVLLPWLVFHTVQQASKYVLERTVYILNTHFLSNEDGMEIGNSVEAVLVSPKTHFVLGLVAGIAAFRVIRHRRRVWFRHAYGSKAYKQCEEGRRRREAVLRADKGPNSLLSLSTNSDTPSKRSPRTWLSNYKRKRHKKKLRQASDRFERHHTGLTPRNSMATTCSVSTTKSRLSTCRQRLWSKDDFDTTSLAPTEIDYDSSSSEENSLNNSPKSSIDQNNMNNNNNRDNTICPNRSSIAHDAVSIPRINNVPYAHGGFFGAAPFFLADRRWVTILRELLPDVYVEISRRVGTSHYYSKLMGLGRQMDYTTDASKLIHWAENNPVVAAYGVAMDLQIKQELRNNINKKMELKATKAKSIAEANPTTKPILDGGAAKPGSIIDQFYNQTNQDKDVVVTQVPIKGIKSKSQLEEEEEEKKAFEPIVIPNLEWDIFVDPQLVRRVEAVLDAMNGYVATKISKKQATPSVDKEFGHTNFTKMEETEESQSSCESCGFCHNNDNPNNSNIEDEDIGESEAAALLADHDHNIFNNSIGINNLCGSNTADVCNECLPTNGTNLGPIRNNSDFFVNDLPSPTKHSENQPEEICVEHFSKDPVMRYLERELEQRTQELTDRLLIAHGNVLQLVMEQSGVLKDWNYSRVQRTRRTLGGGMYARQWMAVFAEALRLGMKKPRKKTRCRNKNRQSNATTRSFFDDEKEDSDSGMSETDALLSPGKQKQYVVEAEDVFEDENCVDNSEGEDVDDILENDCYDPLEDDNNHCTCSPRCCLDTTMAESLKIIERITQTKEPIGILLDLKSRHVPKRVLSLMVGSLQTAGIRVVGIASFEMSDIRGVCSHPQPIFQQRGNNGHFVSKIPMGLKPPLSNTKEILMVHSAGDLQSACDEGLVRPGDHVFFNGGSLILDSARSSTVKSFLGFFFDMCACGYYSTFDPCAIEDGYRIQSYGYACGSMDAMETAECFAKETRNLMERSCNGNKTNSMDLYEKAVDMEVVKANEDTLLLSPSSSCDDETEMGAVMKTLADYKKHYGFSMGLYLQEFSIDEAAARLLIDLVNNNPDIYDLGLAWGGINGMTVHGIQPGRFTSTDGYWNQRRLGKTWKNPF